MYSEVEHAEAACELETDEQSPLRRQRSCVVSVCHTDLTHYGDGRSSCLMSEEDLSPVGSSDQGTAQEAALAAELRTDQGTAQEAALETAQRTTQGTEETADPGWKIDGGREKNYKTKTRIQEVEVEEDKTQGGSNHRDAGRNQALHVHPSLAEEEGAGEDTPTGAARCNSGISSEDNPDCRSKLEDG